MAVPYKAKFSEVQAEFSAPSTAKLSAFNRGGAYVPNIPQNNGVPTSSASIKLSDLDGAVDYTSMVLGLSGDTTPNGSCNLVATNCTARTTDVICSMSRGIGPYAAVATYVSGNSFTVNNVATTESTATFDFSKTNSGATVNYNGVYKITVTDAAGRVATSGNFNVATTNTWTPTLVLAVSGDTTPNNSCSAINAGCTAKTSSITGTASGGVAPYTIGVSHYDGHTFTVSSTINTASTARAFKFSRTSDKADRTYTGRYRLTVTDSSVPPQTVQTGLYRATTGHNYIPTLTVAVTGDSTPNGACSATGAACTARTINWITATGSGGEGTLTYTLQRQSGTVFDITTSSAGNSFKFSTTNSTSSNTYNGVYRIRVTDGSGQTVYTPNFNVQNIHTYLVPDLVLTGSTNITGDGSTFGTDPGKGLYTVTGGGSGNPTVTWENFSNDSPDQSSRTELENVKDGSFEIWQYAGSGQGVGTWERSWRVTLTASKNGKSDSMTVTLRSRRTG